ncbi:MAG: FAD binding domain-containing protein, partial [Nannocystaceae bacterium]|nr:FAD binding domain-containing protein [Nannocystaceae bacterium]
MLRLPHFEVESPETVEGVVAALQANAGARVIAGGTDILPNLKHFLDTPPMLISLARVTALRGVSRDDAAGVLRIGAGVTLTQLAEHPEVQALFPSLASAAGLVASPVIRNMATIGGNVNLDTRCRYVNQSEFWRGAIGGGCLKSEGNVCHVVPKGRNCVAAMSSDNVPVLISLDASIVLVGPEGRRELPLAEYYHADGIAHTLAKPGEVTVELRVPLP